jgi:GNAT superfamily N-acetyltransferase
VPIYNSISFSIEPLSQHHDRQSFSCGNKKLDEYFHLSITQDSKKNITSPYVIYNIENNSIIGYYTLSMSGVVREEFPVNVTKKLPRYPIVGVVLIGRLAISEDYKGFGWGKLLILDSLSRSLEVSKNVSAFAVIVEAIDDDGVKFYEKFNFQIFPDRPHTLFQKISDVDRLLNS